MSERAPILYTLPNLTTAGSGRALFEIARRLDRARFRPMLCLAARGGELEREFEAAGIEVMEAAVTLPAAPRWSLPARALRRARRLAGLVPRGALWHSFHYLDDYTEPLVARAHGAAAWLYTKKNMSWNRQSWQLRTWGATRVLAQNRDMETRFFGGRWARRCVRVPRGVDCERFAPAAPGEPDGPATDRDLVLGCVAHLVPVKGHPTLLDALARAPGFRLRIAGRALDSGYRRRLGEQTRRLGLEERVDFVGSVSDVPSFLRRLDALVLPTWARWRQEGCPVALLEAMASGLPVIATDIPGSRDVVENGRSGLLVPPEDPAALAGALDRLRDPRLRRALGEAARRRAVGNYSIEREVADHESLYREVLAR
ncbi:MAG: glycosyltransferase family 4 protein [Acidobacteriota bacterium]